MSIRNIVNKWLVKFVCTLLALGLAYGVICYFLKSPKCEHLDSITINSTNNEIAISFQKGDFAYVLVFDNSWKNKHTYQFYDAGGTIHEMAYDENGNLYVHLGRENYDIRICPNGTVEKHVDIGDLEYDQLENTWEKEESSYRKTVNGIEYVYDYAGFFDYYWTPANVLYAKDLTKTNIIWSSEKS